MKAENLAGSRSMPQERTNSDFQLFSLSIVARLVRSTSERAAESKLRVWKHRLENGWSQDDDSSIIERALDAALSVMSADCGNLQLVEQDVRLVLKGQRGFSKAFQEYFQMITDGKTACRVAWKDRRLVHVPDVAISSIFSRPVLEALLDEGIRAVVSVPLLTYSGRMIGVLSVHYRQPHSHSDSELRRFERLASLLVNLIAPDVVPSYSSSAASMVPPGQDKPTLSGPTL